MESKWPLIFLTVILLCGVGLLIGTLERNTVMSNWDKRRCNIPVMFASMFFKPPEDQRSSTQFAMDNFEFCMKSFVDTMTETLLTPIHAIFGAQVNSVSSAASALGGIRSMAANMYKSFLSFLEPYFKLFMGTVYEMSRITQYLRMAFRRINAIMMSMVWSGLSLVKTMENAMSFIIKVIMIILGIMVAIIIILFFILFPFMPLIMAVIGSIMVVATGATVGEAARLKSGFCFAEGTEIITLDSEGDEIKTSVQSINIGDKLAKGCGKVTAIIQMCGNDVDLYNLNGVYVSGSHTVLSENGEWILVGEDKRAKVTAKRVPILYCFNTESHNIPIASTSGYNIFRDWEELEETDVQGQFEWNCRIMNILNAGIAYDKWKTHVMPSDDTPLLSPNFLIKTPSGPVKISDICIGDIICGSNGPTIVLGTVSSTLDNKWYTDELWHTSMIEFINGIWKRGAVTNLYTANNNILRGHTIITESGNFIIFSQDGKETIVRDFTEVGYQRIHKTYPFVSRRLRLYKSLSNVI